MYSKANLSRAIFISLFIIFVLNFSVVAQPEPGQTNRYREVTNYISVFVNSGMLTGESGDLYTMNDETYADKVYYGFGLSYERYLKKRIGVGVNLSLTYKSVPSQYESDITSATRAFAYSAFTSFYLNNPAQKRYYIKPEIGNMNILQPLKGLPNQNFGGHLFGRLSLGFTAQNYSETSIRFEAFYQVIFGKDEDFDGTSYEKFNVTMFGVLVGFGFDW